MQIWIILLPFGILCNEFMILDPLPTEYYQTETEICNQNECYPLLFEATNEFEIVKPGQKIRKGLHVSIDFETGKKMAKILDHSNSNDSSLQPI
jgi:nucleotide exchange factor SIL1